MAGLPVPLSTLRAGPYGPTRMTRGRSDSLGPAPYRTFIDYLLPVSWRFFRFAQPNLHAPERFATVKDVASESLTVGNGLGRAQAFRRNSPTFASPLNQLEACVILGKMDQSELLGFYKFPFLRYCHSERAKPAACSS
jgi:hypothetical protein